MHRATVGSYAGVVSQERGTPVQVGLAIDRLAVNLGTAISKLVPGYVSTEVRHLSLSLFLSLARALSLSISLSLSLPLARSFSLAFSLSRARALSLSLSLSRARSRSSCLATSAPRSHLCQSARPPLSRNNCLCLVASLSISPSLSLRLPNGDGRVRHGHQPGQRSSPEPLSCEREGERERE